MSEKQMSDLLALVERQLGKGWVDIVERLRDLNTLDDLEARLAEGNESAVIQGVQDAAKEYAGEITAGYTKAAETTATWLGEQTNATIAYKVSPQAERAALKVTTELVKGFSDEQHETVAHVIAAGVRDSRNPREIARDIRSSIGLTPDQADAVASYRKALENADYSNALGRGLRDGRYDRSLRATSRDGDTLSAEKIDTMVEAYRQKYIAYRAEVIARTQALAAVHAGNDEMFRQAIARGDIEADQLEGQWNPGPKTKYSRPDHRDADLLAQRPKFGEPFVLGDGTEMMHPGDPAGGVENCACCRCNRSMRFAA